jgi:hypothetical protein
VLAGGFYERTSGAAGQPLAGYRRRTPERTVLPELVARHAQTMLAELREATASDYRVTSSASSPGISAAGSSPTVFCTPAARRAAMTSS